VPFYRDAGREGCTGPTGDEGMVRRMKYPLLGNPKGAKTNALS